MPSRGVELEASGVGGEQPVEDAVLSPPPPWSATPDFAFSSGSEDGSDVDQDSDSEREDLAILRALGDRDEQAAADAPALAPPRPPPPAPAEPRLGRPSWRRPGPEPAWHRAWADKKEEEWRNLAVTPDAGFGQLAAQRAEAFSGPGPAP